VSNLDRTPGLLDCGGLDDVSARPTHQVYAGREVALGESTVVRRLLPNLGRRLVGAWCFVDHYGPDDIANTPGMSVPPHPHQQLQTVSWLLNGQVHHRDSLGNDQLVEPGQLGLMTAGRGIAHAEHSPVPHPALLHGAQLWVALPSGRRDMPPAWEHHAALPALADGGATVTVIAGELAGARSPATVHTPLLGADIALPPGGRLTVPLESEFEHAVLVADGTAEVDGETLTPGAMLYLGCARRELTFAAPPHAGARLLLLGGEPFDERIVMWWNFIGRDHDEIAAARADWMAGNRFGEVTAAGVRLDAPDLPSARLLPRGRTRRD
jgi:redox-sensitive bicupin YhaK (pirin superfamily)